MTNGGFETSSSLPNAPCQWNLATGWSNVNGSIGCGGAASPDYYHTGGTGVTNLPTNSLGTTVVPNGGNAVMGFLTWSGTLSPNFREYISTPLSSPMVIGTAYQVSFWLTNGVNPYYGSGSDNIGMHLSVGPLTQTGTGPISVTPQYNITAVTYSSSWVQFSFNITPTSAFDQITIGNFFDDLSTTSTVFTPGATFQRAYYFIDDIVITPVTTPSLTVVGDTLICLGDSTTLTANGDTSYQWALQSAPTSIISTDSTVVVYPTATTTYLLYGNFDTISHTVQVVTPPNLFLGNDTSFCLGNSLLLNATTPGASYLWQDATTNPTFSVTASGTYWAQVTIGGCSSSDTIQATVLPPPIVNLGNDTTLCLSATMQLNAATLNATYLWQDGSTASSQTISGPGTYWVRVTVNGCSTTDTIVVSYSTVLSLNLGNDTVLCDGSILPLSALQAGASYLWSDGSTNSGINITTSGLHWVQVNSNNCIASDTIQVTFVAQPSVNLGNDTVLCSGQSLSLSAGQPGVSYSWQDGSTNPNFTVTQAGTYSVQVTLGNCAASDDIQILPAAEIGVVDLGPDSTVCTYDGFILDATTTNAVSYQWQGGGSSPLFPVISTGTYTVAVTDACKTLSDSISVTVEDCNCPVYLPNAFTPNKDDNNNRFHPISTCTFEYYELDIYNRWGERVYSSRRDNKGWDGKYEGKISQHGIYVYRFVYRVENQALKEEVGTVTLIR